MSVSRVYVLSDKGCVESSVIESLSQDVVSDTINNNTFTLMELRTAFDGLKITRTPGTDGLPAEWLKFSFDCLSNHLLHLFNACLAISYFPSKWRIAVVIILRKLNKPSYDETGSFRPISILCVLGKLFERLIHSRLKKQHHQRIGSMSVSLVSKLVNPQSWPPLRLSLWWKIISKNKNKK